jgi:hypothetical protein
MILYAKEDRFCAGFSQCDGSVQATFPPWRTGLESFRETIKLMAAFMDVICDESPSRAKLRPQDASIE